MINDRILLKKGAESELYLIDWHGAHAISKVRIAKAYRNPSIDIPLRKRRTIHEANILSQVKFFGINTPFIYFLDINNFEIIMEYIEGKTFKDFFSPDLCIDLGEIVGALHCNNIIHNNRFLLQTKENRVNLPAAGSLAKTIPFKFLRYPRAARMRAKGNLNSVFARSPRSRTKRA